MNCEIIKMTKMITSVRYPIRSTILILLALSHNALGARLPEINGAKLDPQRTPPKTGALGDHQRLVTADDANEKHNTISDSKKLQQLENDEDNIYPRAVMGEFMQEFLKPADDEDLSGDMFNKEPFYYDMYYDDVSHDYQVVNSTTGDYSSGLKRLDSTIDSVPSNGISEETLDYSDASAIKEALDLTLLGSDLQSELGTFLEHLTNGSQRDRRHQVPIRVSEISIRINFYSEKNKLAIILSFPIGSMKE